MSTPVVSEITGTEVTSAEQKIQLNPVEKSPGLLPAKVLQFSPACSMINEENDILVVESHQLRDAGTA